MTLDPCLVQPIKKGSMYSNLDHLYNFIYITSMCAPIGIVNVIKKVGLGEGVGVAFTLKKQHLYNSVNQTKYEKVLFLGQFFMTTFPHIFALATHVLGT